MTRFLALCSAMLLSTLFVALSVGSSASAQTSPSVPLLTTTKIWHSERRGQPQDHTKDFYGWLRDKIPEQSNHSTKSRQEFITSYNQALEHGTWGVIQSEYKSSQYGDYGTYILFWTHKKHDHCKFELYRTAGSYLLKPTHANPASQECRFNYASYNPDYRYGIFGTNQPATMTISMNNGAQKHSLVFFSGDYDLHSSVDPSTPGLPRGIFSREVVRPNFKLNVSGKDIQVEHIKQHDRLPDHPNEEPRLKFYVWSCPARVTDRDFNPGSPTAEKIFGFVKMVSDPVVDASNAVVEAFTSQSDTFRKIPETQRDRVLWCRDSQIIRSELGRQGQNFKFTVEKHDYYVVSLEYVFERVHEYGSQTTPDHRYIVPVPTTERYQFLDSSYVFELDGRTFSTDTFSADCRHGFCDLPPAEKDCSYDQQGSWNRVINCHVDNFFKRFTNFFKWLFVPDGLSLKSSFDGTVTHFRNSLGFLSVPFTFIGNLFNTIKESHASSPSCTLPALRVFGSEAQIHLCAWRHQLPAAWSFMQIIIQGGIAIGFLWAVYRVVMRILGVPVDDHDDEDDVDYQEIRWRDDRTGESGDWERRRR